jgi:hypothetical protein
LHKVKIAQDDSKENAHNIFSNKVLRKLETDFNSKLGQNERFYREVIEEVKSDKGKNIQDVFNKNFSSLKSNNKAETLKLLSENEGLEKANKFWHEQGKKYIESDVIFDESKKSNICWKGEIETEFVQLIYGLYHAGYIDNEEHQITKLIYEVADTFNIKLGKNWTSSLSKSVSNTNSDYVPKIFKNLENAFLSYRNKQINKKKKN